jgi:outer membrane protein OmpA-like peptidoglycan-associated protein
VRTLVVVGLALSCGAASLGAQRAHQFEVGAFGSFTRYDRAFGLDNQIGGGARLGYFFTDVVSAELDAGYQSPNPKSGSAMPTLALGSASLVLNFGGDRNLFYLLGGYSRLDFEKTAPYRFTDNAAHGAIGDRLLLGDGSALRLEVRAIYAPSTGFAGAPWAGHVVGSLGLSLFMTGGPPLDSDHDGVPDKRDACPNTPLGATVDARGCPTDSDHDGVLDGLDQCPDTPAGALVDAKGCPIDSDHDGVPDGIDQCPATPLGAHVDAKGCPIDSDGDGVPDGIDQCPNTPAGAIVDTAGCPLDSDKDGVPDGIDKCPNTPPGAEVDSVGCQRFKDSDGDGVDDTKDKCPGTPPGTKVDAAGCPILFTPERTPVILRGVTFETGKSALKPESFTVLDIVAQSLIANPDIRIEIAGYTDSTGSVATNLRLSQARAGAVRAYLARQGVAPSRMKAKGYGAGNPIARNATPAGRAQNRRVELHQLP